MLHLYDRETSGNAYKVRLLLAFLKIPYGRTLVSLKDGKNQIDPAYLAVNPPGADPDVDGWRLDAVGFYCRTLLCRVEIRRVADLVADGAPSVR